MVVTWPIRLRVCDLVVCYVGSAARFLCRVLWVSTRRGMLVAAMVLVVVCDTDFALRMGCMYSDSYQPRNDKKGTTR